MIFGVARLVSFICRFMSLHPGDIISTGTPPGIGMGQKPEPVYLRAGNHVRLGIEGLGEQSQLVRDLLRISRAAFMPDRPETP